VLNGLLILANVGGAVMLWMHNTVQIGSVVIATMLTLRIDSMSEWVIQLVRHVFQDLGIVSEGMGTIAQPVTLVDTAASKPLRVSHAKIEICDLKHNYGRDREGLDRLNVTIEPGEKLVWLDAQGRVNRPC
jgi:ATP-binding cassette subfamily B multidrug efflux pump